MAKKDTLSYTIRYENNPETATAPAQRVYLELPIDEKADASTFRVGKFGFAGMEFDVPASLPLYQARVDARDSTGMFVDVIAGVDIDAHKAFWIFQAVDPATGLPPADATMGLLPVNDSITHKGEGFVEFSIKAKTTAVTGDSIRGKAKILFDQNDTIPTNIWKNIIDAVAPTSMMLSTVDPEIDSTRIPLLWVAQDDPGGCGIGGYNVFVSEDGQAFEQAFGGWPDSFLLYEGERGHTYRFFIQAVDRVSNKESLKNAAEIEVRIKNNPRLDFLSVNSIGLCGGDSLRMVWNSEEIDAVNIAYSTNAGGTFTTLVGNLPDSLHYFAFRVPDDAQPQSLLLRISDAAVPAQGQDTLSVLVHPRPVVMASPAETAICVGSPLELTASGLTGSYYWSPSYALNRPDSNMVQVIATETTRFFVTARDGYGCTAVDSALVIIYPVDSVFLQAIACTEADTGILREVLQSQFGCDSIVVTERMLDTFPPVVITRDIEVVLGADGEVTITPQNVDDGTFDDCTVASLSLDRSTFSCTDLGAQTVWLTAIDQRGNRDSAITLITVVDTRPLSPVCQDLTVYLNGSGQAPVTVAEVSNSSSDNCIVAAKSIMPNQFACNELGPNLATLTITDNAGNTATCTATITVLDTIRPLLACPSNQSIPLYAGCSGVLPDYRNSAVASDNCTFYLTQLPLAGTALTGTGTLTITLIAADPSANDRSCTFTVTRVDLSAPAITCAAHVQVNNDPGQCQAAVTIPGPAVADNCSTLSANTLINNINLSNDASGTYPVGTATVLWTATDASGNTATCAQTVTVIDSQAPSLSCPGPQDVILSGNCDGALPDFRGLVMASDNCSPGASIILDQSPDVNTPLSGYGDLTVVITGHDQAGNPATCFFLVQKTDTHAPTIQCPDPVVLAIGSNCQVATPDFSQNAVFSDNCGTPLVTQYPLAGTLLTGLGATSVTLTAQDVAGNTATCTFVVTRMDQTEPDISCPPDQVLSLNATCTVSLADYRSQANATDNCSITLQQTPVPGTLLNGPGEQPVSITVSDLSGNSSNCSFTIEKRDILPPVITTCPPNRDVLLDPACALTVPDLLPELVVADNCAAFGALDRSQSPAAGTSLPVADGQAQPVLITVSDASGNSSTCWVTLTAQDQTAPTVTCPAALPLLLLAGCQASTPDYTVQALVSDNCSDASTLTLTQLPLAGTFQNGTGSLTVTITASDAAGNTDVCVFAVNVVDETPPLIQCQDLTVPLDASGAAAVSIAELNTGSSDNCGVVNLSKVSGLTTYSCANAGSNYAVVLKATDISGNTATCTAQVTVQDNLPPTALCKNATVSLDASGNAVLPVAAVNNNSSDACGLQTLELSQHSFDCSAIGQHTVQLTVTDNNGNSSGCTTIVAVTDTLAPVPEVDPLPVITVKCSVTVIAPTATDICSGSISATTTDPLTYGNQGTHIITWLYTDTQGNTSTQTQTVVVNNNTPVALLCPAAQSLILDAPTCSVVLPYYGGLSVASDNCGSVSIIQSPAASTVYSGVQTLSITLTAIGSGGNSADCIFPVNIIDQTDPVAHCKHATVYLDPSGLASVSSPQIDNLSTDACTIASTSVSPHEFTCTETGSNTVTLTVTDINGNSATCTATVTVLDTLPPVASCQPATVYLDASGHVTVAAAAINFNSSDACGFQSFNLSQTDYDCTTTATPNALVLTVTDHSGNTATCSTTVTVVDNTAPLALCQDIMVQLGSSGTVSLTTAQIDDGSTDACG
ncbi:MAG: HYR domain-containing protein, partial [Saprospiraceae bacterium]